uniref:Uncharacterized protein n=1 Tax=Poecilia latipinna TaxID=48699 RepID=A0A3B3TVZ3_9TELE
PDPPARCVDIWPHQMHSSAGILGRPLFPVCISLSILFKTDSAYDELVTVNTPPFAESVTEGDVRWEKG